ncbi:unnamed protein product [Withania somnifera]
MSTADWSKLPVELLGLIASRLHFPEDRLRFGAACKSWRIGLQQNGNSSCSFLPWLMLPQRKHKIMICLPDVLGKRCWGSSHGWLVTLGANFEMHLLNPLSGGQISLPPLHKCPNLNLVCLQSCVIFAIYSDNWKMEFAKPGDVAWTPLSCIHDHVDDAMCHDGKFYAIDTFGEVLIWHLAGSFLKRIAFTPSRDMDHLVYLITDTPCLNTWCFKMYMLDVCNEKWEEVKSLGDWSIFVGSNPSFSISFSAYPESYYDAVHGYDMSIYNAQSDRIQPLHQEDISDFAFSLPLWIIPRLS